MFSGEIIGSVLLNGLLQDESTDFLLAFPLESGEMEPSLYSDPTVYPPESARAHPGTALRGPVEGMNQSGSCQGCLLQVIESI